MANVKMYFGLVAKDRELTSRLIKVFVKEMSPYATGSLSDNTAEESYSIKGADGKVSSGKVKTSNVITAEYFDLNTNRPFPPDVVKGEQVMVFQYANSDIYYWISMGRNDDLRRGELMRIAVSDDMAVTKDLTDANTYYIEMDTKISKRIKIATSKGDGEAFQYNLTFDAKNNKLTIGDDQNNKIEMYSDTPRVLVRNTAGTMIDMNNTNLIMVAPADMLIRADGSLTVTSPHIEVVADSITITAGSINVGGEGGGSGSVAVKGEVSMDGNAAISKGLSVGGDITVTGVVNASSFNS